MPKQEIDVRLERVLKFLSLWDKKIKLRLSYQADKNKGLLWPQ